MAAIAYPALTRGGRPAARPQGAAARGRAIPPANPYATTRPRRETSGEVAHLRLVGSASERALRPGASAPTRPAVAGAARQRRGLRIAPALLTVGALAGIWFGTGALTGSKSHLVRPPGAQAVHGGYRYVVRAGDTVWSIASAMEPGADPRPLVDELDAELPGGVLRVGATLRLP
ncbi:MAG: hypothetical protein JWO62_759 [Acidimicrobiaceae bacterium]|jgi:hypothetical protein|nr:hypothetical protein [Acidimicrobiaceae bacterium]